MVVKYPSIRQSDRIRFRELSYWTIAKKTLNLQLVHRPSGGMVDTPVSGTGGRRLCEFESHLGY